MAKTYRAHVDGFSRDFSAVSEIQAWIDALSTRHNLRGHTLKVWKGFERGQVFSYSARPVHETVL